MLVSHTVHLAQQLNQQLRVWSYVFNCRRCRCTLLLTPPGVRGGSESWTACLTSVVAHLNFARAPEIPFHKHQGAQQGALVLSISPPLVLKGKLALWAALA